MPVQLRGIRKVYITVNCKEIGYLYTVNKNSECHVTKIL